MARAYFCAYYSYLDQLEELTEEEIGRLFLALFRYAVNGEIPTLTGNERFIFPGIRGQIDRDTKRYEAICERNRENALMRSQAVAAKEKEKENKKENSIEKAIESDRSKERETLRGCTPYGENSVENFADAVEKPWDAVKKPWETAEKREKPLRSRFCRPMEEGSEEDDDWPFA